ncbi:twin-arginine translocase TatA/TatE family subunit [Desulfosediminicola flagellatus]|uniref:twin-arginine translocase TatA/TatE family subunit n=1 Tax=Desulfosediminicola flagellatus TaxID=2569541 RepID=UPI0010AC3C0F|nr:twin-arginine translocase TatA/TatE family subunit [Desulfosediminicola flagellatus]
MFGIGLPEMILILALALIVVGPDKLPDLARSLAKGIMELKKTAEGLKDQLQEDGNPLDDIRPDLEDAAKSFKSHMLDHPDKGKSDLFPTSGVNPDTDNAAKAYEELKKAGLDPRNVPMDNTGESKIVDLTTDDLTEVVSPEPEKAKSAPSEDSSQNDIDPASPK